MAASVDKMDVPMNISVRANIMAKKTIEKKRDFMLCILI